MSNIRKVYEYREMLYNLIRRDLRSRYKASFLGFLWTFINPLMQLAIYAFVFPYLMKVSIPNYTMFLFVVLLPWTAFSSTIQVGAGCIVGNADMVKKIYFPRVILPLSTTIMNIINYLYGMIIVLIALILTGIGIHISIVWFPIILFAQFLFTFGLTLIFSAINVLYRDVEHIIAIIVMAWFYATPILYTIDIIPDRILPIYNLNPMVGIITAYRDVLFYGNIPSISTVFYDIIAGCIMVVIGSFVFEKYSRQFAEEL